MSGRTTKLLKRVSREVKIPFKTIKAFWHTLSHKERGEKRKRFDQEILRREDLPHGELFSGRTITP